MRVEPVRMRVESSRKRVESTRSMVRLQLHAVCWFDTHASDSFVNTSQNHTYEWSNNTQSAKISRRVQKLHA
jgi:hypothetical protein